MDSNVCASTDLTLLRNRRDGPQAKWGALLTPAAFPDVLPIQSPELSLAIPEPLQSRLY